LFQASDTRFEFRLVDDALRIAVDQPADLIVPADDLIRLADFVAGLEEAAAVFVGHATRVLQETFHVGDRLRLHRRVDGDPLQRTGLRSPSRVRRRRLPSAIPPAPRARSACANASSCWHRSAAHAGRTRSRRKTASKGFPPNAPPQDQRWLPAFSNTSNLMGIPARKGPRVFQGKPRKSRREPSRCQTAAEGDCH
jgi:hypothetical protein